MALRFGIAQLKTGILNIIFTTTEAACQVWAVVYI